MDINTLRPIQGLDNRHAQAWLRAFQAINPTQGQPLEQWGDILERARPSDLSHVSVQTMLEWIQVNELVQQQGQGVILSMRGVATILASDSPRLTPQQAWEHASDLLVACKWINSAPAENAPMEIADVLLFGSLTDPDVQSVGDIDAFVIFKSKQEDAYSLAQATLKKLDMDEVLRPRGSSLPSFRAAAREWLGQIVSFASLDDQPRTLEVLLDQDPNFACFSLLGKNWTAQQLSNTSVDEEASVVLAALERGANSPGRQAYVMGQILEIEKQTQDLLHRAQDLVSGMDPADKRKWWWKNLDQPGLGIIRTTITPFELENAEDKQKPDIKRNLP